MIKQQASKVGLVLGAVFLIMGFARGNPGVWMPGIILFSLGLFLHFLSSGDEEE